MCLGDKYVVMAGVRAKLRYSRQFSQSMYCLYGIIYISEFSPVPSHNSYDRFIFLFHLSSAEKSTSVANFLINQNTVLFLLSRMHMRFVTIYVVYFFFYFCILDFKNGY